MRREKKKGELLMDMLCLLSSQLRSSSLSVEFDFNDSLNDVAPVSPILFTVDAKRNEKSDLLMDVFVCILLSSQPRWRSVSVVFDSSALQSDVAPVSSMMLPFVAKKREE